jgi:hypothetical protein
LFALRAGTVVLDNIQSQPKNHGNKALFFSPRVEGPKNDRYDYFCPRQNHDGFSAQTEQNKTNQQEKASTAQSIVGKGLGISFS